MEPPQKRQKLDGDISRVSLQIMDRAKDVEKWIEERRKNWPTKERIEERKSQQTEEPPKEQEAIIPDTQSKPTPRKPMCRFFLKGNCKAGSKCKFSHERQPQGPRIYKRFEAPMKGSLFTKMVQRDLDKENEIVVDFICYLRERGFL